MPPSALLLALGAAMLHAGWNVLLARARDVRAATAVALVVGVILFAPFAAATWRVEVSALPWIACSAALELVYFVLLTAAYGRSDLSLVYPIARGVAPVLVLVGASAAGAGPGGAGAAGPMHDILIEELELGVRSYNCLKRAGIQTVGDLISKSEGELNAIPNFGKKSIDEVIETLGARGLNLRDD